MVENINFNSQENSEIGDASSRLTEECYGRPFQKEELSKAELAAQKEQFITAICKQVEQPNGLNSLQETIKTYGNAERLAAVIPELNKQLAQSVKGITVTLNTYTGTIKFSKKDKQTEATTYSTDGIKKIEEKIGDDDKVIQIKSFRGDGTTLLSVAEYHPGTYKPKSTIHYDNDGKTILSEDYYKPTGAHAGKRIYMADSKPIAETNMDSDKERLKVFVPSAKNPKSFDVSQYRNMLTVYGSGIYNKDNIENEFGIPLTVYERIMKGVVLPQ